jgi:hypothetical protein
MSLPGQTAQFDASLRRHRSQVMELSEMRTASSRSAAASAASSASARCLPFSCTGSGACGRGRAAVSLTAACHVSRPLRTGYRQCLQRCSPSSLEAHMQCWMLLSRKQPLSGRANIVSTGCALVLQAALRAQKSPAVPVLQKNRPAAGWRAGRGASRRRRRRPSRLASRRRQS